ncbi:MAG: lysophospholipid acyltransferase family protein [Oscillospiraceae bacterium]|nr:lysophospholipid acyltransferase family protein [Oscillospiraceae bacterium]
MLRFYYTITAGFGFALYYLLMMEHCLQHPQRYDEKYRYSLARRLIFRMNAIARVSVEAKGLENLPCEGGYILYANHQGRYDASGVITVHERPLSIVVDAARACKPLMRQTLGVLEGKAFVRGNLRQNAAQGEKIVEEVRRGRRYLIFPEGAYGDNKNTLQEFRSGCFQFAKRAGCPIVPVALTDTYKVFGVDSLRPVRVSVEILPPMPFEQYGAMRTREIAAEVKRRIAARMPAQRTE